MYFVQVLKRRRFKKGVTLVASLCKLNDNYTRSLNQHYLMVL